MTTPAEREFALLPRGFIRDRVVLANFREGLRSMTNPETGSVFTEEEIQRATQPGSRWYNEAQAIDDYAQSEQKRAAYLADQIIPTQATGSWVELHGALWAVPRLQPTGGEFRVYVTATAGTVVLGSTTPNDPLAYKGRDAAGNLYQVKESETVPEYAPAVVVTMFALSVGAATNLTVGTKLTWTYKHPAMQSIASVFSDGVGGRDLETEADWAARIEQKIREEEGGGNDPQLRRWTKESSTMIEDAFIYPCAFYANSVLIAITQKRGSTAGPTARLPSVDTLAAATARMVPPGSPVVPGSPLVLVTGVNSETSDLKLGISMPRGSTVGWNDPSPFPPYNATPAAVSAVASQTSFTISTGTTEVPAGITSIMLWNSTKSRFVPLAVSSIVYAGAGEFTVTLSAAPADFTIATGQWVSPYTARHESIAKAVESYFDSRGPGELVDPAVDLRASRTVRYPDTVDEWPTSITSEAATLILEALGGAGAGVSLISASKTAPSYTGSVDADPGDVTSGPYMLTLGKMAIYAT